MEKWRHLRGIESRFAPRLALLALLALTVVLAWPDAAGTLLPESIGGSNSSGALAQASPISPLNAVTGMMEATSPLAHPGAALLNQSRLALPCVSGVLFFMLSAVALAFWRQAS